MLSTLLPGLRDLRVPLASGFVWMCVAWLAFGEASSTVVSASPALTALFGVTDSLGVSAPVATAALSFLAYVAGMLLMRPSIKIVDAAGGLIQVLFSPRVKIRYLSPSTSLQAVQVAATTVRSVDEAGLSTYEREELSVRDRAELLDRMRGEVSLVATRLLADNRELFDRYDRAEAEASFRLAIALPTVALAAAVWKEYDLPLWAGLVGIATGIAIAAVLFSEGQRKRIESNDSIYQAVFAGKVAFPSVEAAEKAVANKREREDAERADEERRAADARTVLAEEESARLAGRRDAERKADGVTLRLRSGASFGPEGDKRMTSLFADVANDSDTAVRIDDIQLDEILRAKKYPTLPIRLAPHRSESISFEVEPVAVEDAELRARELKQFACRIRFRQGTLSWERTSGGELETSLRLLNESAAL